MSDVNEDVVQALVLLTEWRRKQYIAALTKVALDWHEHVKDWGYGNDINKVEVQAFLDSRHVHYQECWGPEHPEKRNRA